MCPQVGKGFNRGYWMYFESFVRDLLKQFDSVKVVTGPLFLPKKSPISHRHYVTYEVLGDPPNTAVPTHFFKGKQLMGELY
jgi:endonuclease G